jgi:hypothetical protein
MLSKRICEICHRQQFTANDKLHPGMRYNQARNVNRFWKNGYVNCGELITYACPDIEIVPTTLWAGDPLPKLTGGSKWCETIEGRRIDLPAPTWCPFAVEHLISGEKDA